MDAHELDKTIEFICEMDERDFNAPEKDTIRAIAREMCRLEKHDLIEKFEEIIDSVPYFICRHMSNLRCYKCKGREAIKEWQRLSKEYLNE